MRLAITRVEEGAREVPVAMSCNGATATGEEGVAVVRGRLKKRAGTEPHVRGPMKLAMAERPGWRKRSNLWTLFLGVAGLGEDGVDDEAARTALED